MNHVDIIATSRETMHIVQHREWLGEGVELTASPNLGYQRTRAVAAKLGLPRQGFILPRSRLRRRLEPVRNGGLINLVAGPGYGKTAFIVDLLRSFGHPTVYLALDEGDRDPLAFLRYLIAGLVEAYPSLEEYAASLPGIASTEVEVDPLDLTAMLVDMLCKEAGSPTLLALDDFHVVDISATLLQTVRLIAHALPPGWILIISSRRVPPLGLDRVALGGRLAVLTSRELRLTPSEVSSWATLKWGISLQPGEVRSLWRATEGWPAALVLLGQKLRGGDASATRDSIARLLGPGRDLRSYLEKRILSWLEPPLAEVLLAAGLLGRVSFPRDRSFFASGPGEAERRLEELVARGFLVTRVGRRTYAIHPLIQAYAEQAARTGGLDQGLPRVADLEDSPAQPPLSQEGLLRVAVEHLERVGEVQRAASICLRSGWLEEAGRPLRRLALSSLNVLLDFSSEEWLDLLPEEATTPDGAWLLVTRARMLQGRSRYLEAGRLYERAAQLLSLAGDREGLLAVLLGVAYCLFNQGRWEETLDVVTRCRTLAQTPHEKVEVLIVKGNVLLSLCRFDEAVEDWERALAIVPDAGRALFLQRIDVLRARLFTAIGQYGVARQWAERAVRRSPFPTSPSYAAALNALTYLSCQTGDYELAACYAAECQELIRSRGYSFLETASLLSRALVAQGKGDYREAIGLIRKAQRMAESTGESEASFWAEDMFGELCRRNRNPGRALEHHRTAAEVVERERLAVSERVRALAGLGMDLALLGREGEAVATLEETVRVGRRHGLKGSLASALLYLTWLRAREGREQEAARAAMEAMRLAEENEQVNFLLQEARVATPILALCERLGAGAFLRSRVVPRLPDKLRDYFWELAEGVTYPTDVALGPPRRGRLREVASPSDGWEPIDPEVAAGIESLTDREREILKMVSLGMPNKAIAAKLFISEKTVKTHTNRVFRKLGVVNRLQATLVFQRYQRARRSAGNRKPGAERPPLRRSPWS